MRPPIRHNLSVAERNAKLKFLAESLGYLYVSNMAREMYFRDFNFPGICTEKTCNHIQSPTPAGEARGICAACGKESVASVMVLLELV